LAGLGKWVTWFVNFRNRDINTDID
jgi:hypothetical protein